ncbi:hypothetical protein OH76DRAFT_1038106 [Lentinus brumalis]|uniref:Uncharacterized protein n=1 Tax=Lentinus brumalis TaxID=2498619 RepID=A0A371CXA4_9APHY|nr:hypothetical protein OH76DRAFT_1038106 [Polyporus brumalis]
MAYPVRASSTSNSMALTPSTFPSTKRTTSRAAAACAVHVAGPVVRRNGQILKPASRTPAYNRREYLGPHLHQWSPVFCCPGVLSPLGRRLCTYAHLPRMCIEFVSYTQADCALLILGSCLGLCSLQTRKHSLYLAPPPSEPMQLFDVGNSPWLHAEGPFTQYAKRGI